MQDKKGGGKIQRDNQPVCDVRVTVILMIWRALHSSMSRCEERVQAQREEQHPQYFVNEALVGCQSLVWPSNDEGCLSWFWKPSWKYGLPKKDYMGDVVAQKFE